MWDFSECVIFIVTSSVILDVFRSDALPRPQRAAPETCEHGRAHAAVCTCSLLRERGKREESGKGLLMRLFSCRVLLLHVFVQDETVQILTELLRRHPYQMVSRKNFFERHTCSRIAEIEHDFNKRQGCLVSCYRRSQTDRCVCVRLAGAVDPKAVRTGKGHVTGTGYSKGGTYSHIGHGM